MHTHHTHTHIHTTHTHIHTPPPHTHTHTDTAQHKNKLRQFWSNVLKIHMLLCGRVLFFLFTFLRKRERTCLARSVGLSAAWCLLDVPRSAVTWEITSCMDKLQGKKKPFCHDGEWQCHFQSCQPAVKTRARLGLTLECCGFFGWFRKKGGRVKGNVKRLRDYCCTETFGLFAVHRLQHSLYTSDCLGLQVTWGFNWGCNGFQIDRSRDMLHPLELHGKAVVIYEVSVVHICCCRHATVSPLCTPMYPVLIHGV